MSLTEAEAKELNELETEFGSTSSEVISKKPKETSLSKSEQAELASLEKEFGGDPQTKLEVDKATQLSESEEAELAALEKEYGDELETGPKISKVESAVFGGAHGSALNLFPQVEAAIRSSIDSLRAIKKTVLENPDLSVTDLLDKVNKDIGTFEEMYEKRLKPAKEFIAEREKANPKTFKAAELAGFVGGTGQKVVGKALGAAGKAGAQLVSKAKAVPPMIEAATGAAASKEVARALAKKLMSTTGQAGRFAGSMVNRAGVEAAIVSKANNDDAALGYLVGAGGGLVLKGVGKAIKGSPDRAVLRAIGVNDKSQIISLKRSLKSVGLSYDDFITSARNIKTRGPNPEHLINVGDSVPITAAKSEVLLDDLTETIVKGIDDLPKRTTVINGREFTTTEFKINVDTLTQRLVKIGKKLKKEGSSEAVAAIPIVQKEITALIKKFKSGKAGLGELFRFTKSVEKGINFKSDSGHAIATKKEIARTLRKGFNTVIKRLEKQGRITPELRKAQADFKVVNQFIESIQREAAPSKFANVLRSARDALVLRRTLLMGGAGGAAASGAAGTAAAFGGLLAVDLAMSRLPAVMVAIKRTGAGSSVIANNLSKIFSKLSGQGANAMKTLKGKSPELIIGAHAAMMDINGEYRLNFQKELEKQVSVDERIKTPTLRGGL